MERVCPYHVGYYKKKKKEKSAQRVALTLFLVTSHMRGICEIDNMHHLAFDLQETRTVKGKVLGN